MNLQAAAGLGRGLITLAHVIHIDETTSNIHGQRWWWHVACTEKLTAYCTSTAPAARPR